MKPMIFARWLVSIIVIGGFHAALPQGLPKAQPKLLSIIREEVKVGRAAAHARNEAGWPAAHEKAKSPDHYLALTSMTGPSEAWYLIPAESHAQVAERMKREEKDPVLRAEMDRLDLADAEYVNRVTTLEAASRPDLSLGNFPDISKARFFEISIYRVRSGQEPKFEEAAKAYGTARKRVDPNCSYRTYQILAGMPSPTFLVISSVEDYGAFDKTMADDIAAFQGATPTEAASFQKWSEAVVSEETHRFRLDPVQSYVPKETRAQDPDFWQPK